jgi:BRO1-like domain
MYLPLPVKTTQDADIGAVLRAGILAEYGERTASSVEPACAALTELRRRSVAPSNNIDYDLAHRLSYLLAITHVLKSDAGRLDALRRSSIEISWADGFDVTKSIRSKVLDFDRVATIFNIAAAESQLGASCPDHKSSELLKRSASHYQRAAGYFKQLSEEHWADVDVPLTADMCSVSFIALEQAMLANAQIFTYELAVGSNAMSPNACARIAAGIRDLFGTVERHCASPALHGSSVHQEVGRPAAVLRALWDVEAHRRMEFGLGPAMEERLARLKDATTAMEQAVTLLGQLNPRSNFTNELTRYVALKKQELATRSAETAVENIRIYITTAHEQVDPVAGRVLVKSVPCSEALCGEPDERVLLLSSLGPSPISGAAVRYQARAHDVVTKERNLLKSASCVLQEAVVRAEGVVSVSEEEEAEQMKENVRIDSETGYREAIETILYALKKGGTKQLDNLRQQLGALASGNRANLCAIENVLAQEAAEDVRIQKEAADAKRVRERSEALAKGYHGHISVIRRGFEAAQIAHSRIDRSIAEHRHAMDEMLALDLSRVEAELVSDHRGPTIDRTQALLDLKNSILHTRDSLDTKDDILRELEAILSDDEPATAIVGLTGVSAGGEEAYFAKIIHEKYGAVQVRVLTYQKQSSACIEELETSLLKLRKIGEASVASSKLARKKSFDTVYKHLSTAKSFAELERYLDEGLSISRREESAITCLKQDVEAYLAARSTEAGEIKSIAELNRVQARQEESLRRQKEEEAARARERETALKRQAEEEDARRKLEEDAKRLEDQMKRLKKEQEERERVELQAEMLRNMHIRHPENTLQVPQEPTVTHAGYISSTAQQIQYQGPPLIANQHQAGMSSGYQTKIGTSSPGSRSSLQPDEHLQTKLQGLEIGQMYTRPPEPTIHMPQKPTGSWLDGRPVAIQLPQSQGAPSVTNQLHAEASSANQTSAIAGSGPSGSSQFYLAAGSPANPAYHPAYSNYAQPSHRPGAYQSAPSGMPGQSSYSLPTPSGSSSGPITYAPPPVNHNLPTYYGGQQATSHVPVPASYGNPSYAGYVPPPQPQQQFHGYGDQPQQAYPPQAANFLREFYVSQNQVPGPYPQAPGPSVHYHQGQVGPSHLQTPGSQIHPQPLNQISSAPAGYPPSTQYLQPPANQQMPYHQGHPINPGFAQQTFAAAGQGGYPSAQQGNMQFPVARPGQGPPAGSHARPQSSTWPPLD